MPQRTRPVILSRRYPPFLAAASIAARGVVSDCEWIARSITPDRRVRRDARLGPKTVLSATTSALWALASLPVDARHRKWATGLE
ncbi:hypothetical protein trd_0161 [Thermomicrobium roseum DSM 5159]|uniref:Uncharacterized protein n=1 Tax=Thermomicrobium roseum (strain ATCC 27502 / DSM 5159 / P-2) TaxID=309801 RepID=B9KXH4_THERP|nr:hypothetical protein trd_0161 [Thermomicrobium roseum DSM 5159]